MAARASGAKKLTPQFRENRARMAKPGALYWQSARALAVHCPKPLATMLRMTGRPHFPRKGPDFAGLSER
jgi:hypothetical protein